MDETVESANLGPHRHREHHREQCGTHQIAEVHRHRDCIASGFAQRRGSDFDDLKQQRQRRDFTQSGTVGVGHGWSFFVVGLHKLRGE